MLGREPDSEMGVSQFASKEGAKFRRDMVASFLAFPRTEFSSDLGSTALMAHKMFEPLVDRAGVS